jgi:pantoate kinase
MKGPSMASSDGAHAARSAVAWAPGHITGWFAPGEVRADPRARGSIGAGIALDLGVRAKATYRPDAPGRARVRSSASNALPISEEVATRLLRDRPGALDVRLDHALPIGQGFGMSAAGALSTALACAVTLGESNERAVEVAHLADLFGLGGLGGVAAILDGGLELRSRPGIPPWGAIRHHPWDGEIILAVVGPPRPSTELLRNGDFLERVETASTAARPIMRNGLDADRLFRAAEVFTDAVDLGPARLRRHLQAIRRLGVPSGQTMFGNCLWAVPNDAMDSERLRRVLRKERLRVVRTRGASVGARVVAPSTVRPNSRRR